MKEIKAFVRSSMLDPVVDALVALPEIPGVTVSPVQLYARPKSGGRIGRVNYAKIEAVVSNAHVEKVTNVIMERARTGAVGDGKIFISEVEEAVRIRTGERGPIAIQQRHTDTKMDESE